MSTVLRRDRPGRIGQDYFAYFANPYNVTRTVVFALADIAQELYYAAQQRRRDIRPRIKRTLPYALVRSDRKSTRLNSSHANISYAVFCLKKKRKNTRL